RGARRRARPGGGGTRPARHPRRAGRARPARELSALMEIVVRDATADDGAEITRLRAAAVEEMKAERGGQLLFADDRTRPSRADLERRHVLVGALDGNVVGYADGVLEALSDGTTLCRVVSIYVDA